MNLIKGLNKIQYALHYFPQILHKSCNWLISLWFLGLPCTLYKKCLEIHFQFCYCRYGSVHFHPLLWTGTLCSFYSLCSPLYHYTSISGRNYEIQLYKYQSYDISMKVVFTLSFSWALDVKKQLFAYIDRVETQLIKNILT